MATNSRIEWTEMTWNPVTGCSKVSQGCKHCYAERLAKRLQAMGLRNYRNGFAVTLQEQLVDAPRHWREPKLVFVNSMSDLFHPEVPAEFIARVFRVMNECPQHTFQVLTKRSARLRELAGSLTWTSNIWMGVSVESSKVLERIEDLRSVNSRVRFLSVEPLLGPIEQLPLDGIHWVIVGGESGPGARPMKQEWVQSILGQCKAAGVSFFFKQWGGVRKAKAGRVLNGRTYDGKPTLVQLAVLPA